MLRKYKMRKPLIIENTMTRKWDILQMKREDGKVTLKSL